MTSPSPSRAPTVLFAVLIALWTLFCLGLYAAVGFSSDMLRIVFSWFGAVPALEALVALLHAAGGTIVFIGWFFGTALLGFFAWLAQRGANGTVFVFRQRMEGGFARQPGGGWDRPMKDVTPPRDQPPDGGPRRDPPPLITGR